jgi:hypothetical protein
MVSIGTNTKVYGPGVLAQRVISKSRSTLLITPLSFEFKIAEQKYNQICSMFVGIC